MRKIIKRINYKIIKSNISQIIALTEKNIKLHLRYKLNILISYISPFFLLLMPLIIMGQFFNYNENFSPWTKSNYLIFQFLAYNVVLALSIIYDYPSNILMEKYWKTLPGLIIAPFNRFNLLLGIFFARLILISVPIIVLFIICYIYYPITIITFFFVICLFLFISLIFSGIGLLIGVFAITNENVWKISVFGVDLIIWASCLTYPYVIFPELLQKVINLNPLYYIFDIFRLAWLEDNIMITLSSHLFNFCLLIMCAIVIPFLGVFMFNSIYKRYGMSGY